MHLNDEGVARFPTAPCPYCGHPIDAASVDPISSARLPRHGDASICFGCAEPSVFVITALGVSLRRPSADERSTYMNSQRYQLLVSEMLDFKEQSGYRRPAPPSD